MPAAPTGDFYAIPDPLPAGPPGAPIWAERVAAPPGALAWRILYHSRTIHDEDIAVSGLVVAPEATAPGRRIPGDRLRPRDDGPGRSLRSLESGAAARH